MMARADYEQHSPDKAAERLVHRQIRLQLGLDLREGGPA